MSLISTCFFEIMSSSNYGRTLDPYRRLRHPLGVKGVRETVVTTNNPSTIAPDQPLVVRFQSLGADDVIVPGTAKLAFNIELDSTDPNRTLVQNIGRAIVKRTIVRINNNVILSLDDSDLWNCYGDLWKTTTVRKNAHYQGIDVDATRNVTALRVGAANAAITAEASAITEHYGSRFSIPLDFEMLETHMPFYQSGLGEDRLEYEFTFHEPKHVVIADSDVNASYTVSDISLEYEKVRQPGLARMIGQKYSRISFLYDRVLRYTRATKNKEQSSWNIAVDTPARSLRGILLLFVEPAVAFQKNTEEFYNPKITNVVIEVDGVPNQLFSAGMKPYQQWQEVRKFFAGGFKQTPETAAVLKDLDLADVTLAQYLTTKYCLWLDFRSTDADGLHGTGRPIKNASGSINILIDKKIEAAGELNMHIFVVIDAQLQIADGRFDKVQY